MDESGTNKAPFDAWTLLHVVLASALGFLGVPRILAYFLIFIVEIFEFMASQAGSMFFQESRANIIADLAVGIAAYEIARVL